MLWQSLYLIIFDSFLHFSHVFTESPLMDKLSWIEIGDWATSRAFHGLPLIPGLPEDFLPVSENAAWHVFDSVLTRTTDSIRLGIGRLVSDITHRMEDRASNKDKTKVRFNSRDLKQ